MQIRRKPGSTPRKAVRQWRPYAFRTKASGKPASSCRDGYLPFAGVPIWRDDNLTAEEVPSEPAGVEHAHNLAKEPCGPLGLPSDSAKEAYKDAAHFVLGQRKVPIGDNVRNNELEDEAERA